MFTKAVGELSITSAIADSLFDKKFNRFEFDDDQSFTATMRVVLAPRMKDGDHVTAIYSTSSYNERAIRDNFSKKIINAFLSNACAAGGVNDALFIHAFTESKAARDAAFEALEKIGVESYTYLETVSKYFEQKGTRARFYINEKKRCSIVFTDRMNYT